MYHQNCVGLTSCHAMYIIAERLSVRQLIVQCGLKSQLACIYIYIYIICVQLPSRLGMQLNLRLRSLYIRVITTWYVCIRVVTTSVTKRIWPQDPRGACTCSRWRPDELRGCRLCSSDARRIRDLDKLITSFYPGRLTTAPTRLEFV